MGLEPGAVESRTSRRARGVGLRLFTDFKCHGPRVQLDAALRYGIVVSCTPLEFLLL
jgi:hypothetical protein